MWPTKFPAAFKPNLTTQSRHGLMLTVEVMIHQRNWFRLIFVTLFHHRSNSSFCFTDHEESTNLLKYIDQCSWPLSKLFKLTITWASIPQFYSCCNSNEYERQKQFIAWFFIENDNLPLFSGISPTFHRWVHISQWPLYRTSHVGDCCLFF